MNDENLREHLVKLLQGGEAHITFDLLIDEFTPEMINRKFENLPYTAWQLLEHLRIAQSDILEFSRDAKHVSPEFPDGYWKKTVGTFDEWLASLETVKRDLQAMCDLITDENVDLFAKIPHGDGQTILREALLIADHNAYHLGELVVLLRLSR
ncbi:MAG: DinB family protein [Pyrinomonadaceae bacterium]|nr:DinB family protein [Pyrinomonadaceae bacterium]